MAPDYVQAKDVKLVDGWGATVIYVLADEPRWIEKQLRDKVERHRTLLDKLRFVWLWTSKTLREKGAVCAARVSVVNEKTQVLVTELGAEVKAPHFMVEVNVGEWLAMTEEQRWATVDHELCHCEPGPAVVGHDLQEFWGVVERHGLYSNRLRTMAAAMQLQLPGLDAEGLKDYLERGERELEKILGAADKIADGTSVTLSFGDQSVTMDGAAFDRATGRLSQMSDDELRELTGGHDEPGDDQDPQGEAA